MIDLFFAQQEEESGVLKYATLVDDVQQQIGATRGVLLAYAANRGIQHNVIGANCIQEWGAQYQRLFVEPLARISDVKSPNNPEQVVVRVQYNTPFSSENKQTLDTMMAAINMVPLNEVK